MGPPSKSAAGCATLYALLIATLMCLTGRIPEVFLATILAWISVFVVILISLWVAALVIGKWWKMNPRSVWREIVAAVIALFAALTLWEAMVAAAGGFRRIP